jgi:hypothetical protein
MKASSKIAALGTAVALAAAPAVALASGHTGHGRSDKAPGHAISKSGSKSSSSTRSTAEKQCRTQRSSMGKSAFDALYGTNHNQRNAFGKCVSKKQSQDTADQQAAHKSAEQTCQTAQSTDPTGFQKTYGTDSNAFGKCVSSQEKTTADQDEAAQTRAEDNAAKTCRSDQSTDRTGFQKTYGSDSNAFAKCVSANAKAQE